MIFVVIYFVIGFFIEIIFGGLAKVVQLQLHEKWPQIINTFVFSFAGNWLALFIAQLFVTDLTLSLKAFVILASILGLLDFIGEDHKKEKD